MDNFEVFAEAQRLAVIASAAIERAMAHAGLKRSRLAKKLGVLKSRVSKVLDGETNMTLKTLAQFGLACDVRWEFVGVKFDDPTTVITAPETLGLERPRRRYRRSASNTASATRPGAEAVNDLNPNPALAA